jgi:hypothetical protein
MTNPAAKEHETGPNDTDQDNPDEALAARVADAIVELARKPGIHRLAAMQMAGLAGAIPSQEHLARAFGMSYRQIRKIEARALAEIARKHPELRDELRNWKPPVMPCRVPE